MFYATLFLMLENSWLESCEEDTMDVQEKILEIHPEYAAIVRYVPQLLTLDFYEIFKP